MTAVNSTDLPKTPYPDFPLHAHKAGQWVIKRKGKVYSCGPWSDPDAALLAWQEIEAN